MTKAYINLRRHSGILFGLKFLLLDRLPKALVQLIFVNTSLDINLVMSQ